MIVYWKTFDFVCPYMRLLATSFLLHLQKVILIFCFVEKIKNILWFTLYSQKAKYTLNFSQLDALKNTYLMWPGLDVEYYQQKVLEANWYLVEEHSPIPPEIYAVVSICEQITDKTLQKYKYMWNKLVTKLCKKNTIHE